MIRKLKDERGIAMMTGMLVSMIVLVLSITVVQLSMHNTSSSAIDRKRVDAISTAEAGLDATMSQLQNAVIDVSQGNYTLPCPTVTGTLPQSPGSTYTVTINYYTTYPPTGSPMSCPITTAPAGATFVAQGTSITGSPQGVTRTIEAQARLTPLYGGFGKAIFSDTGLNLNNHLTVNGNKGNDGDLYTNGDFTCSNNSSIAGSVFAQGTATISSSCTFNQDLYVKNSIWMSQSATVGHDVTSSVASLTMLNNTVISHNVVVGTACTGCTTGPGNRIAGTVTTGHISPAPPVLTMPQIDYVQSAWVASGFTPVTYADCASARTAILAGWSTPEVVRITPACTLSFNGDTISMKNDVAIVTDGPVSFANHNTIKSGDGNKHILYLIEPTNGISNPNCSVTNRNIDISNQTEFNDIYLFAYSQCTITYNNNNSGLGGQVIGGTVNIQNLYTLTFKPIVIPGGVITGIREDMAFLREIVNP